MFPSTCWRSYSGDSHLDHGWRGGPLPGGARLAGPGAGHGCPAGFIVEALITFILVFVFISVATDDWVADTVDLLAVGFALQPRSLSG